MEKLALSIPGYGKITAPPEIERIPVLPYGTNLVAFAVEVLIALLILLSLATLIWGGFMWIMSGGNKQELEKARQTLVFAIAGLVVAFLAIAMVNVIGDFFGITFFDR